ncbi:MAG: hypothetical protein HKP59_04975 [Lutibacter sp.]|uniref:hypothetical protein n=1 Tax=Lutibacter sp. TaxID=1925666 RepID=UPI0017902FE6|nr:hypothetical protein [Lutibacter sp.]MBT8316956.1 hypothetical protein [Lutibacter sp.]NNJ57816.1 hypothetical protein [Lutibacter sp.]
MKTKLFLIATLFISTLTFSQTTKKGYNYYKNTSDIKKMKNGEEIHVLAKQRKFSIKKYGKMGNHPTTARHNWIQGRSRASISTQEIEQTNSKKFRSRPIDGKNEIGQSDHLHLRKRPGRTKYKN